jgi:hypothetical protein
MRLALSRRKRNASQNEVDDVPDPNLLNNVSWLHGPGNLDKKLIIGRRILPLEKRCRAK